MKMSVLHRRAPSPWSTLLRLGVCFAVTFVLLEVLLRVVGESGGMVHVKMLDEMLLRVALAFVGIDLAVGALLIHAVMKRLRQPEVAVDQEPPAVSVLLPVWNEGATTLETIRAWRAQTGVTFELLVGDDGSTDGSIDQLISEPGVRVFKFAHAGKGATLNALARHATNPILVTIDADTQPTEGALRKLAQAFLDEEVDLATGVVTISNGRAGWLQGNQSAEYLKNAFARIAWSELDALEQVPGAFAGIRATTFRAAGGFPEDSLTEDYELTFRCLEQRPPKVVTVLGAQVFTEGPSTARGFIAQRTRWFAGFLSTLFRFQHLIFRPRAGSYGLVRLPLKLLDAVLPALAFASLIILVRGGVVAALGVSRISLALFAVRWVWDAVVYALALHFGRRLFGDAKHTDTVSPPTWVGWVLTSFEALTYVWFKHASALRGFVFAAARIKRWETSRVATPTT